MTATGPARKERPRDADVAAGAAGRGDGPRLAVAPEPRSARVKAARAEWNRRLVELGGPNTLLWFKDHRSGTLDLGRAHLGARGELVGGAPTRLSDLVRENAALDDAVRRARTIARTSDEVLQAHGTRTCFLAIGMASWTVRRPTDGSKAVEAAAPVLLRSCELRRADALGRDWVIEPGDELGLNPVLAQYMSSAHGIELDADLLEELALSGPTVDGYPTYAALADACAGVPDFSVAPRVVVGTFPFFKAPLVADLGRDLSSFASDDLVAVLAGEAVTPSPAGGTAGADAAERLVLDADLAQRTAVDDARAGSHLVVRGAPGTGKTQTVANLVAGLAADGLRVLLVAPGREALESVTNRLAAVGLGDLVLDVHGGHDRRRVVRELVEGLDRLATEPDDDPQGAGRALVHRAEAVAVLDEQAEALHEPRPPWGVSLHEVQEAVCAFAGTEAPPRSRVRLPEQVLERLDPTTLATTVRALTRLAELSRWDGDGADDPWFGTRLEGAADVAEARERVERLAGVTVEEASSTLGEVFRGIQLPRHPTVLDWGRVLRTVGDVRDTLEVFSPEVFDIPLGDLVASTGSSAQRRESGVELTTMDRWRLRRQARSLLRPGRPPASLHDALAAAHEQRDAWRELAGSGGRPEIPVELDRAREAHSALIDDLRWLDDRLPGAGDGGADRRLVELDLEELRVRVAALAGTAPHLDVLPEERATLDRLEDAGLRPLADDLRVRGVPALDVAAEVEWVWWCSIAEHVGRADVRVAEHDGRVLSERVEELAEAEATVLAATPARVRAAVARRVAAVRRRHAQQETWLRSEAAQVRPVPLPRLIDSTSDLLTAIRPCWAMAALDVPSVLPPTRLFDVVVLEDASALAVAESVPAITRGGRVVVVGDSAQSPPSSFVAGPGPVAGAGADEEFAPASVLELLEPVLPTRTLSWHHRSRDGRLVSFVSDHVYDRSLVTVPDVDRSPVTRLELVEGYGAVSAGDAAVETTNAEVDRVVELVLEHARRRPGRSLAVVALNRAHAEHLDAVLRSVLAEADGPTRRFFDADFREPFVIRPLDLAQGLERDVVVVAVGFGKTPHGRVLHRFGLLGTEAGHRHLTVALTRARRSMTVVSTLTADDLDPDRLKARGPQLLRALLAELEAAEGTPAPDAPCRSVLVADLARRLRGHGLTVHEGVGVGPAPVDLAVEDPRRPGTLLLAVESDGPCYVATGDSRDRDRLRAEQLRRRGWEHLRVWSTDLFRDPARDVARVLDAVGVREAPGD